MSTPTKQTGASPYLPWQNTSPPRSLPAPASNTEGLKQKRLHEISEKFRVTIIEQYKAGSLDKESIRRQIITDIQTSLGLKVTYKEVVIYCKSRIDKEGDKTNSLDRLLSVFLSEEITRVDHIASQNLETLNILRPIGEKPKTWAEMPPSFKPDPFEGKMRDSLTAWSSRPGVGRGDRRVSTGVFSMDRPLLLPVPTMKGGFDAEHEKTDLRRYLLLIEKFEGRRTVISVDFGEKLAQGIEGYITFGSIVRAVSYKRQTVRTDGGKPDTVDSLFMKIRKKIGENLIKIQRASQTDRRLITYPIDIYLCLAPVTGGLIRTPTTSVFNFKDVVDVFHKKFTYSKFFEGRIRFLFESYDKYFVIIGDVSGGILYSLDKV